MTGRQPVEGKMETHEPEQTVEQPVCAAHRIYFTKRVEDCVICQAARGAQGQALTEKELAQQRQSLAYGNAKLSNDAITRESIAAEDPFAAPVSEPSKRAEARMALEKLERLGGLTSEQEKLIEKAMRALATRVAEERKA